MLEETETKERISFFITFLLLVAFQLEVPPLGYAYVSKFKNRFPAEEHHSVAATQLL